MTLQIYTIIHTLIGLVAIFTGFVVVFGLLVSALLAIVAAIRLSSRANPRGLNLKHARRRN